MFKRIYSRFEPIADLARRKALGFRRGITLKINDGSLTRTFPAWLTGKPTIPRRRRSNKTTCVAGSGCSADLPGRRFRFAQAVIPKGPRTRLLTLYRVEGGIRIRADTRLPCDCLEKPIVAGHYDERVIRIIDMSTRPWLAVAIVSDCPGGRLDIAV